MSKTYAEINEKISKGDAVVVTAEEMIDVVDEKGVRRAAKEVDVVTTGTFGPMCSSGAFFNVGHTSPKMNIQQAWMNDVPAYTGLAAVDVYLGATALREDDPLNAVFPGRFEYGGAHVIEELVAGKLVTLRATAYGTDCYPKRDVTTRIGLKDMNEASLVNPRNGYQNYAVAVNAYSNRAIYTYMGVLRPKIANANYCSAGQLSPLLNDPHYQTIGIGTRIFLGGAPGYVYWQGTQHNPVGPRKDNGTPCTPAGTIAVCGDLKQMSRDYLRGASLTGYGVSLAVGIGVPIPILNEDMAKYTAVKDSEIYAPIIDYSFDYPNAKKKKLGEVNYAQLRSGRIEIDGREVPTGGLSSYPKAREIAEELKAWISAGNFLLGEPAQMLPQADTGEATKPMKMRKLRQK